MKSFISTAALILSFVLIGAGNLKAQVTNNGEAQVADSCHADGVDISTPPMFSPELQSVTIEGIDDGGNRSGVYIDILGMPIKTKNRVIKHNMTTETVLPDGSVITKTKAVRIVNTKSKNSLASPGHIGFIEFGFNALTSPDYSMYPSRTVDFMELNNARSQQWAFRLFRISAPLTRQGHLSFSTGIQMVWNNYTFSENIYIYKGAAQVEYGVRNYKKSKLGTFGFRVPLLFEINLPQGFFVALGGYGGVNIGTKSKMKFPKTVIRNPYMNNFYGGVTARVGYSGIGIFANYDLTDLFKKNKGPETSVFTFGISIGM